MGKTQRLVGILLIVAALVLAAYAWVISKEMAARSKVQLQNVVVAAEHIAAGSLLTPEKLRVMAFPTRPLGSFGEVASLLGKQTPVDIAAGEPLLAERLNATASQSVKQLEAGERAVAIRVDEVIAVGNRLLPGDLVDVFVTFRRNNDEIPDSQARLLLSELRILAFGGIDAQDARKVGGGVARTVEMPRTAVLAVPLGSVDKLALAADAGRLLLALRPNDGKARDSTIKATENASEMPLPKPPNPPERALSLRELAATLPSQTKRPVANGTEGGTTKPSPTPVPGTPIKVLHGLKESTVYVGTARNGAGQ